MANSSNLQAQETESGLIWREQGHVSKLHTRTQHQKVADPCNANGIVTMQ